MTKKRGLRTQRENIGARVRFQAVILLAFVITGGWWSLVQCETLMGRNPKEVTLKRSRAYVIETPELIKKVSVTDPDIADVKVVTPYCLVLEGKKTGSATCLVWYKNGEAEVYEVKVDNGIEVEAILGTELSEEKSLRGW